MTALADSRGGAGARDRVSDWRSRPAARLGWVTWRQHRATLIGLAIFLGLLVVYMLVAGFRLHGLNDAAVRDGCVGQPYWTAHCRALLGPFDTGWPANYAAELLILLQLPPIVIGVFLGAPLLARDYAAGTTRYAWSQGTSRTRLTVTKVVLLGLAVLTAGALIGWLAQWSMAPIVARSAEGYDNWQPGLFTATPVTEAAGAGLAFAVGVLAGVVTRHVVPAMAATVVATIVVADLVYHRLQFWLLSLGLHRGQDLAYALHPNGGLGLDGQITIQRIVRPGGPGPAGSWLDQGQYFGPDGHRLTGNLVLRVFYNPDLMTKLHDTFWVTWQPGGRYWLFQFAQGGAEALLAVALAVLAIWLVRRRSA